MATQNKGQAQLLFEILSQFEPSLFEYCGGCNAGNANISEVNRLINFAIVIYGIRATIDKMEIGSRIGGEQNIENILEFVELALTGCKITVEGMHIFFFCALLRTLILF